MKSIQIKLTNDETLNATIKNEELIFGVTAIAINKNKQLPIALKNNIEQNKIQGIHPITGEPLTIILIDNHLLDFDIELLIPAHDKNHFKLAKEHNLKFKQVVAPYFKGTGEQELNPTQKTVFRKSVIAVIKNPENNKYLCVDSLTHPCKSFVMGGIENNEIPEQAALREVFEETGYIDIKITRTSLFTLHNHFYAQYKGVNRYANLNIVFGELITNFQCKPSDDEIKKQTPLWLSYEELKSFLNVKNNIFIYENLLEEDSAFEGDGIMMNSNEFNGKLRSSVKIFL